MMNKGNILKQRYAEKNELIWHITAFCNALHEIWEKCNPDFKISCIKVPAYARNIFFAIKITLLLLQVVLHFSLLSLISQQLTS